MIQIYFSGFTPLYNTVQTIANRNDNISEKIQFIFEKTIEGVDLTSLRCLCYIMNAEETGDAILLKPTVMGEKVVYEWVVENNATVVKGKLQWQLSFLNASTGYVKNTDVCKFKIGDSINVEEIIDITPSLFQQLVTECLQQADRAEEAADASEQSAQAAKESEEQTKEYLDEVIELKEAVDEKLEEASEILEEVTDLREQVADELEQVKDLHTEVTELRDETAGIRDETADIRDEVAEMKDKVAEDKEDVGKLLEEVKERQEDVTTKHTEVTEMKDQVAEDTEEVNTAKEQVREDRNTVLRAMTTMELIREDVESNAEESKELLEQTQGQADNAKSSADAAAESAKRAAETAAGLDAFFIRKYDKLPEVGEERTMYLIPSESPEGNNYFDEYIWFPETGYEYIGNTKLNLDEYALEEDLNNKITMETAEASTPMDLVFKVTSRNIVYNTTIKVSPYMGIRIVE